MHDEVQRMVECGNGRDHADRLLDGERPAVLARRRQPHRDFAPSQMLQFTDGTLDPVDRSRRLDSRIG